MPGATLDKKHLLGEMASHYGIRLDESDPALAIVALNLLALEQAAEQIREHIRAGIAEFTEAVQKTEARGGKVLAEEVRTAAAEVRRELQGEIRASALRCRELLRQVHAAHQSPELIRWAAIGVVFSFILFCCGVWLGKLIVFRRIGAGLRRYMARFSIPPARAGTGFGLNWKIKWPSQSRKSRNEWPLLKTYCSAWKRSKE